MKNIRENDLMEEAHAIARQIDDLCIGRDVAAVMMAMSTLFGRIAAHAERPDLDGLMKIVHDAAEEAMIEHRAELIEAGIIARPQ